MRVRLSSSFSLSVAFLVSSLIACGTGVEEAPAVGKLEQGVGSMVQVTGFGSNPGNLKMYKYVPDGVPANAPLVVALHGCSQTAAAYSATGWNALAETHKFHVLYPEQQYANNGALCFNWAGEYGDPTNLKRGEGENLSIKQMVDKMKADHGVDPARVFVTGFSGGGAQAALLMATWPDVFSAAGILAGIPYNCTTTFSEVSSCLNPGKDRTPADWGALAKAAFSSFTGKYPRLSVWHGTADGIVKPLNQQELVDQWSNVHGIDQTADFTETVLGHTRKEYRDATGAALIETWEVSGMGHGVPVNPQAGCGTAGAYVLSTNICSTERIARFFGIIGGSQPGPDTQDPAVEITAPTAATVSGIVAITANATDNVAVTKVEFRIDSETKATVTAAPFAFDWNTAAFTNGAYVISVHAFDAAGNEGQATLNVTVDNQGAGTDTKPPMTFPTPGAGAYQGPVEVTFTTTEPATTWYTTDGSEPTTASTQYTAPIAISTATKLKFFSMDAAGNKEWVQTHEYRFVTDAKEDPPATTEPPPAEQGECPKGYVCVPEDQVGYGCSSASSLPNAATLLVILFALAILRPRHL